MFKDNEAFSGFSVNDIEKAKRFYGEVLGIAIDDNGMGLGLKIPGASVFIYPKDNHEPATFTVLNFKVGNIEDAVTALKGKNIALEHYDGLTDEDGIARGLSQNRGPDIAWFKDPAGNILSVLQES